MVVVRYSYRLPVNVNWSRAGLPSTEDHCTMARHFHTVIISSIIQRKESSSSGSNSRLWIQGKVDMYKLEASGRCPCTIKTWRSRLMLVVHAGGLMAANCTFFAGSVVSTMWRQWQGERRKGSILSACSLVGFSQPKPTSQQCFPLTINQHQPAQTSPEINQRTGRMIRCSEELGTVAVFYTKVLL